MKFQVQSAKTKQFLYESVKMPGLKTNDRAIWTDDRYTAKVFENPIEAENAVLSLSSSTRARIVLWDGASLWNVTRSK